MRRVITSFFITVAVMIAALSVVLASSNNTANTVGKTQKTSIAATSCGACHSPMDAAITAMFIGPNQLYPGDYGDYGIQVMKTTTAQQRVGIDVAASDTVATLTTTAGATTTALAAGVPEVTHVSGGTLANLHYLSSGNAAYGFRYTCPASSTAGESHFLYGATVLGNTGTLAASQTSGWNFAATATVTTKALPTPPATLTASTPTSSSVPLSWSAAGPQYRILAKTGTFATSATDGATATVYEGSGTSVTATGLNASTAYYFSAFSKDLGQSSGASFFSTTAAQTTATTGAALDPNPWVDANSGNDNNAGSGNAPFKTIKKALTAVGAGGTIHVMPGTYNTALGETFPITIPSGIKLQSVSGPNVTTINATGSNTRAIVCSANSNTTLVEGFTITGGLFTQTVAGQPADGGGILTDTGDQSTISRCIITGNEVRGFAGTSGSVTGRDAYGGGVAINGAQTTLVNCVISNNIARGGNGYTQPVSGNGGNGGSAHGGGVFAFSGTPDIPTITNCTFNGNQNIGGNGGGTASGTGGAGGGVLYTLDAQNAKVVNSIFSNNVVTGGTPGSPGGAAASPVFGGVVDNSGTNNLFFNNVGGDGVTGTNALVGSNPLFVSAPSDLHLRSASPARRAGTSVGAPAVDVENNPRTMPPTIGAYEIGLYLTATPGIGRIVLTWPGVSGATSYNLYMSQTAGVTTSTFQTKVTGATSPYVLSPLANNQTYYFVITAVENGVEGPISPEVSATSANNTWVRAFVQAANGNITGSNFTSITRDLANGNTIYATTSNLDPVGLYKSTDGGTTWSGVSGPFAGTTTLRAVAANGLTIMVAGTGTIYRSIDGGANWTTPVTGGGIGEDFVAGLAIDPLATNNVYAGDFHINGGSTASDLIARSVNGGATFANIIDPSSTNLRGYFLQVDPAISGTLYAAGSGNPNIGKSTNNGNTWSSVSPVGGYPQSLALAPSSTLVLFAGMRDGSNSNSLGVYKSANGGTSWTTMNTGLPVTLPDVSALLVDPGDVMRVHAGTTAGYYTTTNGATTWTIGPAGGPYPSASLTGFNRFAQTSSRHLLATAANGVYMLALDPPPTISTVMPTSGAAGGGTSVTVAGSNFTISSGLRVLFGGTDGTVNLGNSTPTSISVTTPAHAGGPVDVTVINPDGQAATSTNAFAFNCTNQLSPTSANYSSSAGSGSIQVSSICSWTATAPGGSFVSITSGSSGTGNGTVQYSVAANSTATARSTTLTVAGQSFVVSQSASGVVPMMLNALAANGSVSLTWNAATGATSYEVRRSNNGGAFNLVTTTMSPTVSFNDGTVVNRTGYLYQIYAIGSGGTVAFSNVDLAVPFDYTDPTLTIRATVVKAVHLAELRLAANAARAALGWAPLSFTDGSLSGLSIKRIHLIDLRSAVDAARAGVQLAPYPYADSTITANTTFVRLAHVQDLRDALK